MDDTNGAQPRPRRGFFKETLAVMIGSIVGLVPFGAGLMVYLDPLRRKASAGALVKVTTLAALPADGVPRKFPVLANRADAWNKYRGIPVGAVYLRRTGEKTLEALNVVCPHAGCFVDFKAGSKEFFCPCHNSSFQLTGAVADPKSPSPRGMDSLEVRIRNESEVWVKFQNFRTGQGAKVPVS